jgi:hypothetical protein
MVTSADAISKGREGDAANAILPAVGHNLRPILAWLRELLLLFLAVLVNAHKRQLALNELLSGQLTRAPVALPSSSVSRAVDARRAGGGVRRAVEICI